MPGQLLRSFGNNLTNQKQQLSIGQVNKQLTVFNPLRSYHLSNIQTHDPNTYCYLTIKQANIREKLFKWVVSYCQLMLELKPVTCEHAMRLFDLLLGLKYKRESDKILIGHQAPQTCFNIIESKHKAQLDILSCLSLSAKYNQIYPPAMADFVYMAKEEFEAADIIRNQFLILQLLNFQLNISLTSNWYNTFYDSSMPQWGLLCLPEIEIGTPISQIAATIRQVEKNSAKSRPSNTAIQQRVMVSTTISKLRERPQNIKLMLVAD